MLDDTSRAWLAALEAGDVGEAGRLEAVLDAATALEQARRNRPGRILDAALTHASSGVAVFPLAARGKTPLTPHGFKDATIDAEIIRGWWAQWPDANLGFPTGLTFDVVDVDGPDGMARMYATVDPLIDTLTVLGAATTSRDGGRHVYVPVSGYGNKAGIYAGIDYRGTGGYVVAPPSVGANGRRYEWVHPLAAIPAVVAA